MFNQEFGTHKTLCLTPSGKLGIRFDHLAAAVEYVHARNAANQWNVVRWFSPSKASMSATPMLEFTARAPEDIALVARR
jgi:hypothetical protein